MSTKLMSFMNIGDDAYEIADEEARDDIDTLTTQLNSYNTITITPTLRTGFELYNDNGTLVLRKQGNVVYFRGVITPSTPIEIGASGTPFADIPVGFRPNELVYQLCQGSNGSMWFLQVNSSGVCYISRFRDVSDAEKSFRTTGASDWNWFPFSITWIQ